MPDPRDAGDPYLDRVTGILANKIGARTQAELDRAEHDLVTLRAVQLDVHPIAGKFDLDHLRAVHRHLFQDVYPFAGEVRTVNIYKLNDPGSAFFPVERFAAGAAYVFGDLAEDNFLRGRAPDRFAAGLAKHFDAINHLHPFREGNGRTQRIFVDQLATAAGYQIDWTSVTPEQNVHASREGVSELRGLFTGIVTPLTEGARRARIRDAIDARTDIDAEVKDVLKSAGLDNPGRGTWRPTRPTEAPQARPNRGRSDERGPGFER